MRVAAPFQVRRPRSLSIGEVYELWLDGAQAFAMAIEHDKSQFAVAFASSDPNFQPLIIPRNETWDDEALVYPDAFIELVPTSDLANTDANKEAWRGCLRLAGDAVLIRAREIATLGRAYWIDLRAGGSNTNRDMNALYATRWRLWASSADRALPGATPLVDFTAQAPQPR